MPKRESIWYLAGPFYQYEENVKAVARAAGVRIIDANVTDDREGAAENPPRVTLKPEYGGAPAASRFEVLHGSDKLPAHIEIGSGAPDAQLGTIVAAAHAASGLSADDWNKLKPAARDKLLKAQIELLQASALAASLNN